jgi:hypothetical protein
VEAEPDIVVTNEPVPPATVARLTAAWFGDMVKFVVDLRRGTIAVGGDLHADAEALLLDADSEPRDLWGGNYYPGAGPDACIEYTSLINIRPSQGNAGMEVEDRALREQIRAIVHELLGKGEPAP